MSRSSGTRVSLRGNKRKEREKNQQILFFISSWRVNETRLCGDDDAAFVNTHTLNAGGAAAVQKKSV